mgnify:CR=1 FL=1
MLIGIDFDNTIVSYDSLFYKVAAEQKAVPTTVARTKLAVRDHLRAIGKEDVLALEPGETIQFYRNFRTFCGKYVAHCHNLAHEDHNMMFGWTIRPKP